MDPAPRPFAAQLLLDLPPAAARHVLGVFQDEVVKLTGTLTAAAQAGDAIAFGRAAHSIAGSAGAVGATALEQGARLAMAGAKTRPELIVDLAAQIAKLGESACIEAKAVAARIP